MAVKIAPAVHLLLLAWTFAALASTQNTPAVEATSSTATTATVSATPSNPGVSVLPASGTASSGASSASPAYTCSTSDTAYASGCKDSSNTDHGVTQYYFVFLALIICVAGLGAFLVWRKKKRARQWAHTGREHALANDISTWEPTSGHRRRNWQGRWRSAHISQEEGLDEHGEAPPPYVPKSTEEEQALQARNPGGNLAIPLQTLSREDAGLKPPDYTEMHTRPVSEATEASSAGTSREAGERHDA